LSLVVKETLADEADGDAVTVWYTVSGSTSDKADYTVSITASLPAPTVAEANDSAMTIDPADVTGGITVIIPASANLVTGDTVSASVSTAADGTTTTADHTVTAAEAGKALSLVVKETLADEADGDAVTVWYTVAGVKSASALYEIGHSGEDISNVVPVAVEATGKNGTLLQQVDYYRLDSLTIKVPSYRGMASGDTVKIYWVGRAYTYGSNITTVSVIGDIDIPIPRMEFIDTIGYKASVYFTVKKSGSSSEIKSSTLYLDVEGQSLDLKAPDVSDDLKTVTVTYTGMSSEDMVEVRVVGKYTNDTPLAEGDEKTKKIIFHVDSSWLETNEYGYLLYNYAVGVNGGEYQFSQVSRVK
ncbi:hypothetical protein NG99_02675, partial [Erwinia typographi]